MIAKNHFPQPTSRQGSRIAKKAEPKERKFKRRCRWYPSSEDLTNPRKAPSNRKRTNTTTHPTQPSLPTLKAELFISSPSLNFWTKTIQFRSNDFPRSWIQLSSPRRPTFRTLPLRSTKAWCGRPRSLVTVWSTLTPLSLVKETSSWQRQIFSDNQVWIIKKFPTRIEDLRINRILIVKDQNLQSEWQMSTS